MALIGYIKFTDPFALRGIGKTGSGIKAKIVTKFSEYERGETIEVYSDGRCYTNPPLPLDFFKSEGGCEILNKNMELSTWEKIKKLIKVEPPMQRPVKTQDLKAQTK